MASANRPPRLLHHWRHEVPPWQRFPLRLMAWYGGAAVLLVAGLSVWSYHLQMDAEISALQHRLLTLAGALAVNVDGDAVFGKGDGPDAAAYWEQESGEFRRIAAADPDAGDVYLLRTTDRPGRLVTLVDVVRTTGVVRSKFLQPYDARGLPKMLAGLKHPAVEDHLWSDRYPQPDGSVRLVWSISGYAPIRDHTGKAVAVVGVDVMARRIAGMRRGAIENAGAAFALALALLGAVTVVLGRQIVGPLAEMIDATDAIAHGELAVRIKPDRVDEFGVLGRHFDEMADGLEDRDFLRDTFGRYVSPRVAEAILSDKALTLGGEVREVTVLFTDLRGYSTITEHADPPEVVRLLNDYLAAMNEVIDAHDGVVIEFLGDGILAVFGAPVALPEHPHRAVDAALAMRARLEALNDAWEASGRATMWKSCGIDRIVMRMGVHTGRVVAGNLGSRTRMKYAVIGDNVNVAARLEQYNKQLGTTLLVSGAVRARLGDGYDVRPRGTAKVKGREDPVEIFSL